MKANTVVVISGRVCAPTKPVPEKPEPFSGRACVKDYEDFLSSCVPFEDQSILNALADKLKDSEMMEVSPRKFKFKENHPYTVPEYEFKVRYNGCCEEDGHIKCQREDDDYEPCQGKDVAVLVDEKKVEPMTPKDKAERLRTIAKRMDGIESHSIADSNFLLSLADEESKPLELDNNAINERAKKRYSDDDDGYYAFFEGAQWYRSCVRVDLERFGVALLEFMSKDGTESWGEKWDTSNGMETSKEVIWRFLQSSDFEKLNMK